MINQELIELVNSGGAWAFVGSGVSVDAGLPSWRGLIKGCKETLAKTAVLPSSPAANFHRYVEQDEFPRAFQVLADHYGKPLLDETAGKLLSKVSEPGRLHKLLAKWPFIAYITTNFDGLLDDALASQPGGWVPVGNTASETAKISKEVAEVIWHPHGCRRLREKNIRLVLTSSDYDEIYPSGSPVYQTLLSVLRMCRFVFVGFGFSDPDLDELLKRVSRISRPGFPAFAFLHGTTQGYRDDLKSNHNVEVIPYEARNGNHSELFDLLRVYQSFIVTRDIQFGTALAAPISYHPAVTSLLVQNRIQTGSLEVSGEAHESIMRASILSSLAEKDKTMMDLEAQGRQMNRNHGAHLIRVAVDGLTTRGLLRRLDDSISLTSEGKRIVNEGSAAAQLKREQFLASLQSRARAFTTADIAQSLSVLAADFLENICRDRGLGVAQNLVSSEPLSTKHRTVALIQELPKWFSKCSSKDETTILIEVITNVLQSPTDLEKEYLGLFSQAYFGKHLAGFGIESLELRRQSFGETLFVCDSHFLIPLLARSSTGHSYANNVVDLMTGTDAKLVATELLLLETSEHAEFALNLVGLYGESSTTVFDASRGTRVIVPMRSLRATFPRVGWAPVAGLCPISQRSWEDQLSSRKRWVSCLNL